jgi:regulator of RNase E activity RraA
MWICNERVQGVTKELLDLYKDVCPSTIGHMTDFGFIKGLESLTQDFHFVGNAVTVQLPHVDGIGIHNAVDVVKEGDVLCVNTCGEYDRACMGEIVAYAYMKKKVAAIIIDGCITDVKAVRKMGMPVFSKGVSPLTTRSLGIEAAINVPVSICGVVVKPGDLVVGDDDGILAIDPSIAKEFGERAVAKQNGEPAIKVKIDAGQSLPHINGNCKYFEGIIK